MSSHHPKSAYAELLSLREWMLSQKTIYVGDVHTEIDRRLATADRGEANLRDDATPLHRFVNACKRGDATEVDRDAALYDLCRRALGRDQ